MDSYRVKGEVVLSTGSLYLYGAAAEHAMKLDH